MKKLLAVVLLLSLSAWAPQAQALSPEKAVLAALADADQQAAEDQPFLLYLFQPDDTYADFLPAQRLHVNLISTQANLAYPKLVCLGLWRVDIRDYGWSKAVVLKLADIDPYFHRRQIADINVDVLVEVVVNKTIKVEVDVEEEYDQEYGSYDKYGNYTKAYTKKEKRKVKKLVDKVVQVKEQVKRPAQRQVRNQQLYAPQAAGQLAALALLLQSSVPIVRADWFLVQGARQISLTNRETGAGYYNWLGVKDRGDYFELIGLDARAAAKNEIRAVIGDSGVTAQNRQVVRDGATNGGHWSTLEVFDQSGAGIAIQTLRKGEFAEVAEEHYAPLPNGLPVTFLSDAQGVRQDAVPDKIAGNKSALNVGNDTRVHVNIACMQCHAGQVLQPLTDDVRVTYTGRLGVLTNDKNVSLELNRSYATGLNRLLARDRGDYQDVFKVVTGLDAQKAAEAYSQAFTKYAYGRVGLQGAAIEFGVKPPQLVKALKDSAFRLGRGDFRTDPWLLDPPGTIARLTYEDAYQDIQDALYGILQVDQPRIEVPKEQK